MTTFFSLVFIVGGFLLLIKGADWLVTGGTSIARKFNMSDLVIGLTIVSFGTSAPELIVNIVASFKGNSDIAIGNIVGSNLANMLLILGITAAIRPLMVQKSTVYKEIPFSILAAIMLFILANDQLINFSNISILDRSDGMVLIGFFIIFMYYIFGISKETEHEHVTHETIPIWRAAPLVIGGIIALGTGGELVVRGAVEIASSFGMSQAFIGLTIVAIGTSLPELTASIVAGLKGKSDIAVGNIIGSNIFNIFWILGISAIINPLPFQPTLNLDMLLVIASTILVFICIKTGRTSSGIFWRKSHHEHIVSRSEGILMLCIYLLYIGYIAIRG